MHLVMHNRVMGQLDRGRSSPVSRWGLGVEGRGYVILKSAYYCVVYVRGRCGKGGMVWTWASGTESIANHQHPAGHHDGRNGMASNDSN